MSSTVPSNPFAGQLEEAVRDFLKEKLEFISNVLQVEHPEAVNRRNGSYERTWETRYGRIDDLQVPRDRAGLYQTQVFEPYQRREGWVEFQYPIIYKHKLLDTVRLVVFFEVIPNR